MGKKRGNKNKDALMYIIVGGVIVALVLVIYLLATSPIESPTPSQCNVGVSLYYGTKLQKCLTLNESAVTEILANLRARYNISSSKRIIQFGATWCPHCNRMHQFFEQYYGDKVIFIWVDEDKDGSALFNRLVDLEVAAGVDYNYAGGVPHILVLDRNGNVQAIVIGEAVDKSFWDGLLS